MQMRRRAWAYERGYKSLIIVTSDYHMPRSLIVLKKAMPDLELIALACAHGE